MLNPDEIEKVNSSQSLLHTLNQSGNRDHDAQSFDDLSGQVVKVSISHDGEYATAVCLAADEPDDGDVGGEAAARKP